LKYRDGESSLSIRSSRGEFRQALAKLEKRAAALQESFDGEAPLTSIAGFALDSALAQQPVQDSTGALLAQRVASLLHARHEDPIVQSLSRTLWNHADDQSDGGREFTIPSPPIRYSAIGGPSLIRIGPAFADAVFPRGSWPWTLTGCWALIAADDFQRGEFTETVGRESQRLIQDPTTGPFGKYVIVRLAKYCGFDDKTVRNMANLCLKRWDDADIADDLALLTDGEHGFVTLMRALAGVVDDLDESDRGRQAKYLPDPWSVLTQPLVDRRSTHPDEPPEHAVRAVLLEAWQTGYRDFFFAELRELAGGGAAPETPMTATPTTEITK
jgi:hypothetical protein